ncbi:MAG: hypothetical protein ACR2M3_21850 [Thermomicrobiales bacterium]
MPAVVRALRTAGATLMDTYRLRVLDWLVIACTAVALAGVIAVLR